MSLSRRLPPLILVALLLLVFTRFTWPGRYPPVLPDSMDYQYGAVSLLHGGYSVDWDGSARVPRYTPGFPLLLTPAIAIGGPDAVAWVPYVMALGLGVLAALVSWRVAGPLAAPLAVALVLYAKAPAEFAGVLMSDLPAATIGLAEVALLMLGRSRLAATCAGLLAGALIWIRPASAVLVLAGLASLSARRDDDRRKWILAYVAAAAVPLVLLGAWQGLTYGSPFTSSYQAAGAGAGGGQSLGAFFSPGFVMGDPFGGDNAALGGSAMDWNLPNLLVYPLQLVGADAFLVLPGVGLLGVIGLFRFAGQPGPKGVFGRFGLATVALTLAVYLPYYWQTGRFLVFASTLLALSTAMLVGELVLVRGRSRVSMSLQPRG